MVDTREIHEIVTEERDRRERVRESEKTHRQERNGRRGEGERQKRGERSNEVLGGMGLCISS